MKITYRNAIKQGIQESMLEDDSVFLMGEEVGKYGGAYKVTTGLLDQFGPQRIIDTPISEYGFAGIGVGSAFNGLRPIVEFMSWNFALQAIDHILNSAAKTKYMSGGSISVPIVFRGPNGYAPGVGAQHSQCFAGYYARCPGIKVVAPYNANHAKTLLKQSILEEKGPIVFLEHELLYGKEFEVEEFDIKIGQCNILKNGQHVTMCSFSHQVEQCLLVANDLLKEGIDVEVIDIVTISPLDLKTIQNSVKKTSRLICVEEGWSNYSVSEHIVSLICGSCFEYLNESPKIVSMKHVPMPYAKNLEAFAIPSYLDIKNAVLECMKK